jgi:hypothetical protein
VLQFDMPQMGIACLGESAPQPNGGTPYRARFTNPSGEPLRLLTLYRLMHGRKSVAFLWPQTADYAFELNTAPGVKLSYVGFLPDGRLATLQNVPSDPATEAVQVLKMQVTASPVKDIQELTQLIDQLIGL